MYVPTYCDAHFRVNRFMCTQNNCWEGVIGDHSTGYAEGHLKVQKYPTQINAMLCSLLAVRS